MRPAESGPVTQPARCAKTRSGSPCKSAPVTGRRRCRMHGGADGSGAPKGERNGNYKDARYTAEVTATRRTPGQIFGSKLFSESPTSPAKGNVWVSAGGLSGASSHFRYGATVMSYL
jgi:hypothetical protein